LQDGALPHRVDVEALVAVGDEVEVLVLQGGVGTEDARRLVDDVLQFRPHRDLPPEFA
jgi:hypothetical protein